MPFLGTAKLWLIGAGLAALVFGLAIWRAYAKGEAAAQTDIAIAGLNKAIAANTAKRQVEMRPADEVAKDDPYNRDTLHKSDGL